MKLYLLIVLILVSLVESAKRSPMLGKSSSPKIRQRKTSQKKGWKTRKGIGRQLGSSDHPSTDVEAFQKLQNVTVWSVEFDEPWDRDVEDDFASPAEDYWTPGYLMLKKLETLELDEEFVGIMDPRCISTTHTTTTSTTTVSASPNATIMVDTTACPSFDVLVQVVNSGSSGFVITPDGDVVPFVVYSTDYVGTLHHMDVESYVMDALTSLWSIELAASNNSSEDQLILNHDVKFNRIEGCESVSCFGAKVFARTTSFWSLDGYRSDPDHQEWSLNTFPSVGLWMQLNGDATGGESEFQVSTANFGIGSSSSSDVLLTIDLPTGAVKSVNVVFDAEGLNAVSDSLESLNLIVGAAEEVSFDLSDVPWSVQIRSQQGDAILYASYIGEFE